MRRSGVQWLLAAVVTAVLVVLAWEHRWMSDDGFIHLRVVEQLRGGNGPVFNVGERVEASTSPLWVLLLTLADPVTGLALPWKAVLLGIALTALGLVAAQAGGWTLARASARASGDDGDVLVLPVGALVVALLPPFWDFASSGLESGLVFAWIGGSSWWCANRATAGREPSPRAEAAGAALVGLGWLIRPDLLIFSLAFGAVVVAATWRSTRRRRVGVVVALVAAPVVHQVFRMGYYAMLVPNTALAKEAGHAQWAQGWRYLANLMGPHRLWLPVGLLVVLLGVQAVADVRVGDRRLRAAARLAPAGAALVHGAYTMRAGGDFMHGRLLLPALFGLVAPVGLTLTLPVAWLFGDARSRVALASGALVVAAVGATVLLPRPESVAGPHIEDERRYARFVFGQDHPVGGDLRARVVPWAHEAFLPPEAGQVGVIALDDPAGLAGARVPLRTELPVTAAAVPPGLGVGAYGTPLDLYAVDPGSLAHPVGSHLDQFRGPRPGHQKTMPVVWQVAGLGEVVEVRTAEGRVLATRDDHAAAHRAVSCGRMGEYLDDIRAPLTPGRFLGNVIDSVGNTFLRIPPDPQEAESDLCG